VIQPRENNPWDGWRTAAQRGDVDHALQALYGAMAEEVSRQGAVCWLSGKCCHFDAYGHRLYVTGLEVAWVLDQAGMPPRSPAAGHACPYQSKRQCTIHAWRPMGCRIFFCQDGTEAWQHDLYERKLKGLREIHDRFGVDYGYMEWLAALDGAVSSGCFAGSELDDAGAGANC